MEYEQKFFLGREKRRLLIEQVDILHLRVNRLTRRCECLSEDFSLIRNNPRFRRTLTSDEIIDFNQTGRGIRAIYSELAGVRRSATMGGICDQEEIDRASEELEDIMARLDEVAEYVQNVLEKLYQSETDWEILLPLDTLYDIVCRLINGARTKWKRAVIVSERIELEELEKERKGIAEEYNGLASLTERQTQNN